MLNSLTFLVKPSAYLLFRLVSSVIDECEPKVMD